MDVVKNAVENLNTGQTPVLTFDQPLYALAKQIQWKWPEKYGEDQFVVMFGGLHIEMAALRLWVTGYVEVDGYKHWYKQRLLQQEQQTPSSRQHMLHVQEGHTKSQLLPYTFCNIEPITTTVLPIQKMERPQWTLMPGVMTDNRIAHSFSTGQQQWH